MSFVSSYGSTVANPFTAADRYLLLAHTSTSDVLLLNEMNADGGGYKPSKTIGLLSATDRSISSIVSVQASYKKTQWAELAFVMTVQQYTLFSAMLLAQTPSSPITLSDRIESPMLPVDRNVIVESPNGREVFGNLSKYLVQFSALQV